MARVEEGTDLVYRAFKYLDPAIGGPAWARFIRDAGESMRIDVEEGNLNMSDESSRDDWAYAYAEHVSERSYSEAWDRFRELDAWAVPQLDALLRDMGLLASGNTATDVIRLYVWAAGLVTARAVLSASVGGES